MNLDNIQDSKSYAVKVFFNNGHSEQIKFATNDEMESFASSLESSLSSPESGQLVTLVLDDGTNIRIQHGSFYMFKSFRMTPRSSRRDR